MTDADQRTRQSLLDTIRERGFIRIAAHWGDTSAQYLDPETGEPAGMVALVGRLLARDLGVRAEFVDMPWASQIPALLDGRVDISVKHTNTPQRAFDVEFTVLSILCEEGRIVIRRDSGLNSEEDLNQPHRTIAVPTGASQLVHIHTRFPRARVQECEITDEAFDAVAEGQADACLHDTKVESFLRLHPECTVLTGKDDRPVVPYVDCVHPCIRPGDQRFLNWLNSWMAFHWATGTFERLLREVEEDYTAKLDRILGNVRSTTNA